MQSLCKLCATHQKLQNHRLQTRLLGLRVPSVNLTFGLGHDAQVGRMWNVGAQQRGRSAAEAWRLRVEEVGRHHGHPVIFADDVVVDATASGQAAGRIGGSAVSAIRWQKQLMQIGRYVRNRQKGDRSRFLFGTIGTTGTDRDVALVGERPDESALR